MNKIANYDSLNYDYSQYWKNREYENSSEKIALEALLKNEKGKWFIDIGGSYGRVTPIYYKKYKNCIILDYSLKTLQSNYKHITTNFPNVTLIAANAYHLPFKECTFDGGLMVRVLHHIEKPEEYFYEIHRILRKNSLYIQEYANKKHIKAVIKNIITFNFSIFNKQPYQQPNKENYEGARKDSYVPFLNYHPKWIKETLEKVGFKVKKTRGCSFFRVRFVKKLIPSNILLSLENVAQKMLSWSNISPSLFVKSTVNGPNCDVINMKLDEMLCCPICKVDLNIKKNCAKCTKCERTFLKKKNIWDFRI